MNQTHMTNAITKQKQAERAARAGALGLVVVVLLWVMPMYTRLPVPALPPPERRPALLPPGAAAPCPGRRETGQPATTMNSSDPPWSML